MYCRNNKHEVNTSTYKTANQRHYKKRSSLDEDLCPDCLEDVLDWKNEHPEEVEDEDFEERELNVPANLAEDIKDFVLD